MTVQLLLMSACVIQCFAGETFSCTFYRQQKTAKCLGNFPEAQDLKEAMVNITQPIHTFELSDSKLDFLPPDLLEGQKNLRTIILTRVGLEHLKMPDDRTSLFDSVQDSLERFEVYDSSNVFGWDLSVLNSLTNLKTFIVENSDAVEVSSNRISVQSLRLFQLVDAKVRWIHRHAFKDLDNVTIFSLAHNHIEVIERSMFPRPATKLYSLDLSYNKLKRLPKDIFTEMEALRDLKLDFNELKHLQMSRFDNVWDNLLQLWLDGNKVTCWSFCSAVRKENQPMFFGSSTCQAAQKKYGFRYFI